MYANKGHGWDFQHFAVDDASRLAYAEILPSQGQADTTAFLVRSITWFSPLGIGIERVMTDNGSTYRSKPFAKALRQAQAHHIRTRPYTPRTNGKQSASSSPLCANGPMPDPNSHRSSAASLLPNGPTNTTSSDLTPVSTASLHGSE